MDEHCIPREQGAGTEETCWLLNLPWEDLLYTHIFPIFTLKELFNLRAASNLAHECVEGYFTCCTHINTTRLGSKFSAEAFNIVTKQCSGLRRLTLRNSKNWLKDEYLIPVLDGNPKICYLDLTNCTTLSNKAIQKAAISCNDLQELRLHDCIWLSDEGMLALAMNCPLLRHLDISGCWDVKDDAVSTLALCCTKLEYLSIAKIYGLTDNTITNIAKHCTNLRHLNMQGCWRVTDDSVRLLGEYCKSLRGLQIRECRDITEISLARLRAKGIRVDIPQNRYQVNPEYKDYLEKLRLKLQV